MSKILVISNDPALSKKNLEILRQNGLEVDSTPGCLDGLVMMGKNNFNVIVIDDLLSDVSGYEACLKVRRWQQGALIILLGTIPGTEAWSREKELGFDLYLRKPVSAEELPARIKALLKRPGAEKEAVKAAAMKPVPVTPPESVKIPAKTKAVPAATQLKGKEPFKQTAARQPVRAPEPANIPPATPKSAVSAPVYSQPRPEPVKPEIKVRQQSSVKPPAPPGPGGLSERIKALFGRRGTEKKAVKAETMKPAAAAQPEIVAAAPAKTEAVHTGPDIKGMEAVAQTAAQQPVRAAEPTYSPPATPQPAASGPVYIQRLPEPVKPEIKIPQQVYAQAPASPPPVPAVPPAPPSIPPIPVHEAPEKPRKIVPEPVAPLRQEKAPVIVPPLERDVKRQSAATFVANHAVERPDSTPGAYAQTSQDDTGAAILGDPRVIKLVDALVSGKLPDIDPIIDFSYKRGFAYPSVSSLLDTSEVDTINILESLSDSSILIKQPYDKFYVDPDGLFQLVPIERCSRCDSSDIVRGQLVEHYSCGYVGLDRDFKQESRYVCPKCRKDLRLIGTDYRNVGIHYRCQDCSEVFTVPVVKWRNMKTRKIWTAEELREVEAYSYRFSPDKKGWLEFQLKPKTQLVDFLKHQGYQVHELAQLTGRSGAVHTVDVLAVRDDIITKINLGIGILVAPSGEPEVGLEALFKFDTRAYDIGINYKVVIAIPRLGLEALNFADRQMIRAFEAKTMATVVLDITHTDSSNMGKPSRADAAENRTGSVVADARGAIVRFLRNRGYEVYERAQIPGKSGIEHIFDIFARRDDKIVVPTVAIGIGGETGQPVGMDELSKFDAAAFDAGIRNKVFLSLSETSSQAMQFAVQQKIDMIGQQDLLKLT